jgi:hypothetical protein
MTELKRLSTLERKDGAEELRVTLDQFTDDHGKVHRYLSARLWFKKDDGSWCPTKKGITIRMTEIRDFALGLKAGLEAMNEPASEAPPEPSWADDERLF